MTVQRDFFLALEPGHPRLDATCKLSPCPFAKVASGQITELSLCAGTYRIQQIARKPLRVPGTLGLANCKYQAETPL
jgi:hypothetical protein